MGAHIKDKRRDLREMPAYGINEAAHYLGIPKATLRSWVLGRPYSTRTGERFFRPIIELPDKDQRLLSFVNLVEAHVLDAIRRVHGVTFGRVRKAVEYLKKQLGSKHPLAEQKFATDGVDLFIEAFGRLVNVSQEGQLAIRDFIQAYLQRIERDPVGAAIRLYPFTRERKPDEPKIIVIDPSISFGRPVLVGTGIATTIIAQRYKAGESVEELAEDYGRSRSDIEEAIRCELWLEAA
ncbi:MAG: DUF433 domain-containing protein [Deltaproteobacteria bacterium]|nr:DUF433 domain-containing protein [Deltaproteobacteria bacterium]